MILQQLPCPEGGDTANTLLPPKMPLSSAVPVAVTARPWAGLPVQQSLGSVFPMPPQSSPARQVSLVFVLQSPVYEPNSVACMSVSKKTKNPELLHCPNTFCKQVQRLKQGLLKLFW